MTSKKDLDKGLTGYGDLGFSSYLRRSFAKSMGYSSAMLDRPIIGIATSASGFNNCHRLTPQLLEAVKRGVIAAGGSLTIFSGARDSDGSISLVQ